MPHYGGKTPFTFSLKRREMLMLRLQQENKEAKVNPPICLPNFQVLASVTLVRNCPRKIVTHCLIDALVPYEYLLVERARYIKNSYTISSVMLSS